MRRTLHVSLVSCLRLGLAARLKSGIASHDWSSLQLSFWPIGHSHGVFPVFVRGASILGALHKVKKDTSVDSTAESNSTTKDRIRNFCIIAHVDHGKSTMADRLLENTNTISSSVISSRAQFLDDMDLERERGITIKLRAARMRYRAFDGEQYCLQMIDCPGHSDFSYEVSRSLAAVEGALLIVDASQGVQAQTVANVLMAQSAGLKIVPVINKVDLPSADRDRVALQVASLTRCRVSDCIMTSAKLNVGIQDVLEAIVDQVPSPVGDPTGPLQALIFDSYYDVHRGVVLLLRIFAGTLRVGDSIVSTSAPAKSYNVMNLGCLTPSETPVKILQAGDIGYITAAIKSVAAAPVGDTITHNGIEKPAGQALPGYKRAKAVVYGGLYPTSADDFELLRMGLEKLRLSDAALEFRPDTSAALGHGFRVGYLGLLHAEIVRERVEREFGVSVIATAPSVNYKVFVKGPKGVQCRFVSSPAELPDEKVRIEEPFASVEILTPEDSVGALIELCQSRRGCLEDMDYLGDDRVKLSYSMPVAEVIADLADIVKSKSRGYASMDYTVKDYKESDLVKMNILLAKEKIDALATVVRSNQIYRIGKTLCQKLRETIPRAHFAISIQACVGGKVVASESISPLRKDVTAKCYGGDVSRKKKLLKKQAEGKKRMKALGKVRVPQEMFTALLALG